ncbi:uncharacterized protein LOC110100832 [Dendrobium catenatum]|uniref:uncharacterized protein LOC110100832 n=1 Tax=Dendrobium catenatum TaxID=906689 RepID=UPI00109FDFB9|nr:uncharacterized protein LOC110100832 [Dendrobium catenatum]
MAVDDRRLSACDCLKIGSKDSSEHSKESLEMINNRLLQNSIKEADGQFQVVISNSGNSDLNSLKNDSTNLNSNLDSHIPSLKWNGALVIKDVAEHSLNVFKPVEGKGKAVTEMDPHIPPLKRNGALVIKEILDQSPNVVKHVEGKGKAVAETLNPSSSGIKLFVNRFGNSNAIPGLCRSAINESSLNLVNKNFHSELDSSMVTDDTLLISEMPKKSGDNASANPWSKKPYINLDFNEKEVIISEDGIAVKLIQEMEDINSKKLSKSLVIKVFGRELHSYKVAWELRKQWNQFGQFHFTTLGKGWFLCSFSSVQMSEEVLAGGPWFVNEHIIGMEKWTPEFSTNSNKGLSSPIWIRMHQLPLQCWDEKNIACIASMIGKPLMLDGNMFQWGRREFARVCVRISLDKPLPLGVWVDSISGRFFQPVKYEKVSNLCYGCGKIGHMENDCELKVNNTKVMKVTFDSTSNNDKGKVQEVLKEKENNYGPWIMVNNKKRWKNKPGNKLINNPSTRYMEKSRNPDVPKILEEKTSLIEEDSEEGELSENVSIAVKNVPQVEWKKSIKNENKVDDIQNSVIDGKLIKSAPLAHKQKLSKELKHLGPGANKREASLYLNDFVKSWYVLFVGLVETKISSFERYEVNKCLGDDWDYFLLPSVGASGGIMVFWKANIAKFSLIKSSSQCVIRELCLFNNSKWLISTIYGNKNAVLRRKLWEDLEENNSTNFPMIIGGDFNCILSQEDKRGGKKFSFYQGPQEMAAFMARNDLHDVGIIGPKFTWCNNKSGNARILERLDGCLLNYKALNMIQNAVVRHLPRIAFDHCPLIIRIIQDKLYQNKQIKFEEVWASFQAAKGIVFKSWNKLVKGNEMDIINVKCKRSLKALYYWSRQKLKCFKDSNERLKTEIAEIQSEEANESGLEPEKLFLLRNKIHEFNVNLARLSTWWRQRTKLKCIQDNDTNSRLFHSFANGRRMGNIIHQLKNDAVIKESGSNISPGLDGTTYSFFKHYWYITGNNVWKAIQQAFITERICSSWK